MYTWRIVEAKMLYQSFAKNVLIGDTQLILSIICLCSDFLHVKDYASTLLSYERIR